MQSAKKTLPVCAHSCLFPSPQCRTTSMCTHTHTCARAHTRAHTKGIRSSHWQRKDSPHKLMKNRAEALDLPSRWSSPRGSREEATAQHTHGFGPFVRYCEQTPILAQEEGHKAQMRRRSSIQRKAGRRRRRRNGHAENYVCRLYYNSNGPYNETRLKKKQNPATFPNPRTIKAPGASLGDSKQKQTSWI